MTSRVRGISQLAALIPYEFGFVPHDSLVVMLFRGNELTSGARFDRADCLEGLPEGFLRTLQRRAGDTCATGLVVVGFNVPPDVDLADVEDELSTIAPVEHALVVSDGEWLPQRCLLGCCADGWQPLPKPADIPVVADYVARGVSPFDSREGAQRPYTACVPLRAAAVEVAARRLTPTNGEILAAWRRVIFDEETPTVADVAVLAAALADVERRDIVMCGFVPEFVPLLHLDVPTPGVEDCVLWDSSAPDAPIGRLHEVLSMMPLPWRATWVALLALGHWRAEEPHVAQIAATAALELDDHAPMVSLTYQLVHSGRTFAQVVAAMARGANSFAVQGPSMQRLTW